MFLLNSRYPLACAPSICLRKMRASFFRRYGGNLPSSFRTLLSSALVYSTRPPVSVSGTVYTVELFPGTSSKHVQSDKDVQHKKSVTTTRPTNINVVPIDYPLRARLRGRLTLLRLALSRNPWSFGERASHPLYRYSCLHSHFRYLHDPLPDRFTGLRNAPLPRVVNYTP